MRIAAAIAGALAALAGPAAAQDEGDPLAPLRFMAGACWLGAFADSELKDLNCVEEMQGGFLRSRHVVLGTAPEYGGETVFYPDNESGLARFIYFTSDGGISRGSFAIEDGQLVVPDQRYIASDGREIWLHSLFEIAAPDAYSTVTRQWVDGEWSTHFAITFERLPEACRTITDYRAGCAD